MAGKTDSLYVSNLPYSITDESLSDAFAGCTKAKVIIDPNTGRSKGFGFVTFESIEAAASMYDSVNGQVDIDGRECKVHYAHTREEREERQGRYRDSGRRGASSGSRYSGGGGGGYSRDSGSRDSYSRGGYGREGGYSRDSYSRDGGSAGYGGYKKSYSSSGSGSGGGYTQTGYGYSQGGYRDGNGSGYSSHRAYGGDYHQPSGHDSNY